MRRRPAAERFFEKVDKTDTCWLWTGAAREACPAGHAFTPENTYIKVKPHPTSRRPSQMCRTCNRERAVARRAARRLEVA